MAKPPKYPFPTFLDGIVAPAKYTDWLRKKSVAHILRDRGRGNEHSTNEEYKMAIHAAVLRCGGRDEYTDEPLDWHLIGTYDNARSKAEGRAYKALFGNMPTVDHIGDGVGPADFGICGWSVNDAKSDLNHVDFVALCRKVVANYDRRLDEVAERAEEPGEA